MATVPDLLSIIQRPRFSLSESEPVRVMESLYAMPAPHPLFDMHIELELGIVLDGELRRHTPDSSYAVKPGEVWCCGVWEPHGYAVVNAPCRVLVIVIWPSLLINLHMAEAPFVRWMAPFHHDRPFTPRTDAQRLAILALAQRIIAVDSANTALKQVRLRLLLLELLLILCEETVDEQQGTSYAPDRFVQLLPAIELALQTQHLVTNEEAASACALSVSQFIRQFDALMGISFTQFALRHRVHGAAEEIAATSQAIKTIAHQWGFTDASHLHRVFVQHYGCTPSRYRQYANGDVPTVEIALSAGD